MELLASDGVFLSDAKVEGDGWVMVGEGFLGDSLVGIAGGKGLRVETQGDVVLPFASANPHGSLGLALKGCPTTGPRCKVDDRGGIKGLANRRKSWLKKNQPGYNYALGEDISWDRIEQMANFSLVGRFIGRSFSLQTVVKWAEACWSETLGEAPKVVGLTRGWYAFNFRLHEHDL